jgi:hypothetical protein
MQSVQASSGSPLDPMKITQITKLSSLKKNEICH